MLNNFWWYFCYIFLWIRLKWLENCHICREMFFFLFCAKLFVSTLALIFSFTTFVLRSMARTFSADGRSISKKDSWFSRGDWRFSTAGRRFSRQPRRLSETDWRFSEFEKNTSGEVRRLSEGECQISIVTRTLRKMTRRLSKKDFYISEHLLTVSLHTKNTSDNVGRFSA